MARLTRQDSSVVVRTWLQVSQEIPCDTVLLAMASRALSLWRSFALRAWSNVAIVGDAESRHNAEAVTKLPTCIHL
jgi:hypothetical protein